MLDVINGLANGWVASQAVRSTVMQVLGSQRATVYGPQVRVR